MSSSLEYLPLFIFVLTLTYKKKRKEGEKDNKKQKTHPTTKRMDAGGRMVIQPVCHRGAGGRGAHSGAQLSSDAPWAVSIRMSAHRTLGSGISSTEFGAAVDTSHAPIGPFQILRYHVTKGKLSGPEGHAEELVNFMWFPRWLDSYKRGKKRKKKKNTQNPTSLFTED